MDVLVDNIELGRGGDFLPFICKRSTNVFDSKKKKKEKGSLEKRKKKKKKRRAYNLKALYCVLFFYKTEAKIT